MRPYFMRVVIHETERVICATAYPLCLDVRAVRGFLSGAPSGAPALKFIFDRAEGTATACGLQKWTHYVLKAYVFCGVVAFFARQDILSSGEGNL